MKNYPGVSRCNVCYVARREPLKGIEITYTYYKARIWANGRIKYLGNYQTAQEAIAAYAKANRGKTKDER